MKMLPKKTLKFRQDIITFRGFPFMLLALTRSQNFTRFVTQGCDNKF